MSDLIRLVDQMYDSLSVAPETFKELYNSRPELQTHTPWLYQAARSGDPITLRFLLSCQCSPNELSGGAVSQSALCAAASEGCVECVQMLLQAGAIIDVETLDDNPIFNAIWGRSLDCVRLLVEAGIDIHRTYTLPDSRRRNALEFSQRCGCSDIAEYLLSNGAKQPV